MRSRVRSALKIDSVEFVVSAAGARDLPDAGLPEWSMVGRSNVGKSTLINGLVKRPVARTSATPGKTRLINVYRVAAPPTGPFYFVDLPGYGYTKKEARDEFNRLAAIYFARAAPMGVLLALDARHPGMENDLATLQWLRDRGFERLEASSQAPLIIVVTKMDKLSRNERARTLDRFEHVCGQPVIAVSAATGEGLEDLWKQMASWAASMAASRRSHPRP